MTRGQVGRAGSGARGGRVRPLSWRWCSQAIDFDGGARPRKSSYCRGCLAEMASVTACLFRMNVGSERLAKRWIVEGNDLCRRRASSFRSFVNGRETSVRESRRTGCLELVWLNSGDDLLRNFWSRQRPRVAAVLGCATRPVRYSFVGCAVVRIIDSPSIVVPPVRPNKCEHVRAREYGDHTLSKMERVKTVDRMTGSFWNCGMIVRAQIRMRVCAE